MASYGASVIRVDRPGTDQPPDLLTSYKSSIVLDLKNSACRSLLRFLLLKADVLIDPFRPGVLERMNLDPQCLVTKNKRLIVLRLTGFRRDGQYKDRAGHDINYLAVSGLLSMLGSKGAPPTPPMNILGDYAGGGLVAFAGVLLGIIHRGATGQGQVVETNMVDGASYLGTVPRLKATDPSWNSDRGTNLLDGGCPYYRCYECRDSGKYISVGALEPAFFKNLLRGLEMKLEDIIPGTLRREDRAAWPAMHRSFEERFKQKTRHQWEEIFNRLDACVAPVLEFGELQKEDYPQRPLVNLTESPANVVDRPWKGFIMRHGHNGKEALRSWLCELGKDYEIVDGIFMAPGNSKL